MKWEIEAGLWTLGVIIIIILSILTANIATLPLPAPLPLGGLAIFIIAVLRLGIEIMRGKSPHAISNAGYGSITASKDIYHFPWTSDLFEEDKDGKKQYGDLTYMFPGGIDYWGFNPDSTSEYPVWIFPRRFEGKIGKCFVVYAHLWKTGFKYLPPEVRKTLKKEFSNRVTNKTPICFGLTSSLDGSATPDNQKIIFKMQDKYKYSAELEELNEKLFQALRKVDEQKSKRLILGTEVKPIKEEP